jgi:hypothetical protein
MNPAYEWNCITFSDCTRCRLTGSNLKCHDPFFSQLDRTAWAKAHPTFLFSLRALRLCGIIYLEMVCCHAPPMESKGPTLNLDSRLRGNDRVVFYSFFSVTSVAVILFLLGRFFFLWLLLGRRMGRGNVCRRFLCRTCRY